MRKFPLNTDHAGEKIAAAALLANEVPKDLFLGNVLGAFSRALSDKMDSAVTDAVGMSTSAVYTIVQIGTEPDSTIDELRKMLSLEHSSLVRMLDRLEKSDLIVRNRGKNGDRRSVSIVLTESGEECFSKILRAKEAVLSKATSTLTEQEEDFLLALIEKMAPKIVDEGDDQHYVCRLCNMEVCPQEACPVNLAYPETMDHPEQPFRRPEGHSRFGCVN